MTRAKPMDVEVVLSGQRWRIRDAAAGELPRTCDGDCDSPDVARPLIRIRSTLTAKRRLEVLVHEVLHASLPVLAEEAVQRTGENLSKVLWRIGWRNEHRDRS